MVPDRSILLISKVLHFFIFFKKRLDKTDRNPAVHTVSSASVSVARVRLGAGGRLGCGFFFGHSILLVMRRDKTDAVLGLYFLSILIYTIFP